MTQIGSSPSNPSNPRPQPRPEGAKAAAATPARAVAGDRFETSPLTPDATRSLVEADLRLSAEGGLDANADGSLKVQRTFVERLIPHALRDCREIKQAKVRFDPQTRDYVFDGVFVTKGIRVPFSTAVHPTVQNNTFGFQIDQAKLKAGPATIDLSYDMLRQQIARTMAKVLSREGFTSSANGAPGFVGMDLNAALHKLDAVPYYLRLDSKKTQLSSTVGADGLIELKLRSDRPNLPVKATPLSDMSLVADDKAVAELLTNLVGPDLEVKNMTFKDNEAVLHGAADAKPISDALTAFKALFMLAALSQGAHPGNMNGEPVTVRVSLDIAARMEGTDVVITPSMDRAVPEMLKALTGAGLAVKREGDSLRVDTNQLAEKIKGRFDRIAFTPQGLEASAHVNLDRVIGNPALVGEANSH